jgi:low temperature requirement protein LtrA
MAIELEVDGDAAATADIARRPWHVPMTGRDPTEVHRASTPLELLFDLCFVVAVAQAAGALHDDLAHGSVVHGLVAYLVVFFAIWWPWMNFTWFASAYDTDDVQYRLLTFVQIAGVLVVAAGVPAAFDDSDFRIMVVGYVIMRIGLVPQWLRAAREDPAGRPVALRYATAITLIQIGWILRLALGNSEFGYVVFLVLGGLDLIVPWWAERAGRETPWHPGHIIERYGLFTIIVLGECVLATSTAVQAAFQAGGAPGPLLTVGIGGLLLVFALWWAYFKHRPNVGHHRSLEAMIAWGYGHYAVFASVAALGAGLEVAADSIHEPIDLGPTAAALTVAIPVTIFLVADGVLHLRTRTLIAAWPIGVTIVLVLGAAFVAPSIGVPLAILAMGLVACGLVATLIVLLARPERAVS